MLKPAKNPTFFENADKYFVLILIFFNFLVFFPFIGHGFIHDDFSHLYSVIYDPLTVGVTKANAGPFYTPLTWLSFKIDWLLWGKNPFHFAVFNLILHVSNVILLYFFTKKLWKSRVAARWTAGGFALLFPANIWAVMWISTRAHILAAFFYLAALTAVLWMTRTEKSKYPAAATAIIFAGLSLFSKESGATLIVSVIILIIFEKISQNCRGKILPPLIFLSVGILSIFCVYFFLRSQSGAVSVTLGGNQWYSYAPSLSVFFDNLARYGWRTYGLLSLIAAALSVSFFIRKEKLNFNLLTRNEILLSLTLFLTMIAPCILLTGRSGIYTYLPGFAAALLLGAFARSIYEQSDGKQRFAVSQIPPLVIIAVLTVFTVGQTQKWVRMAETNESVLAQINALEPQILPGTSIILEYSDSDSVNGFPDGFASWSFVLALRLKYADQNINGALVKQDEPPPNISPSITFIYTNENGKPKIVRKP